MNEADQQSVRGEEENSESGAEQAPSVIGRTQSSAHFSAILRVCCQAMPTWLEWAV